MISRHAVRLAACAVALGSTAPLSLRAHAQGAPFTIRRPPDGSTVREAVRVQIPRSSIGEKSFVVMYIDGKFDVALDPQRAPDAGVLNSDGTTTTRHRRTAASLRTSGTPKKTAFLTVSIPFAPCCSIPSQAGRAICR